MDGEVERSPLHTACWDVSHCAGVSQQGGDLEQQVSRLVSAAARGVEAADADTMMAVAVINAVAEKRSSSIQTSSRGRRESGKGRGERQFGASSH